MGPLTRRGRSDAATVHIPAWQRLGPTWSPDGRIVYDSSGGGAQSIYRRAADSTAAAERLTRRPNNQRPLVVSADGRHLVFEESTSDTAWNPMRLTLDGASSPEVLLGTPFDERNADLSPDGRWMAYESNETGQIEVYVRPFPESIANWFENAAIP